MDAASLFDLFRSSVLGVAFVSNAILMADTPPCKDAPCQDAPCQGAPCQGAPCHDAASCNTECSASSCPNACCDPVSESHVVVENPSAQQVTLTIVRCASGDARCEERVIIGSAEEFSVQTLAHWMGRLLTAPKKISARLAVHGVVPEIELDHVVACGHKICVGGKCFEVDDDAVEGKACDQEVNHPQATQEGEDPIVEVPAAPPLPPSYQFTAVGSASDSDSDIDAASDALEATRVEVPVSALVSLMVANAETSTRLEMTEELMSQQQDFSQQMIAMIERNAQLKTQIAVMEVRQQYTDLIASSMADRAELAAQLASHPNRNPTDATAECKTESGLRMTAIQEDLANIRRQIALLKRHSPVPFAPSYVGATLGGHQESDSATRTARGLPYVPVSPVDCAAQGTSPCTEPKPVGSSSTK